jgi:predicted nucleotidyltransferase
LKTYDAALRRTERGSLIFGSRARGDDRRDSDLDLFIDYDPEAKVPNIFRLMQLEDEISEQLGMPVTITTRNALHPSMKGAIEREAIRVL